MLDKNLISIKEIYNLSEKANSDINEALEYKTAKYVFLDFNF